MNEFEMLARQGYPMKRLVEMAGGDWDVPTCPDCGAPDFACGGDHTETADLVPAPEPEADLDDTLPF